MNAKQLRDLFRKYNLGEVYLEKEEDYVICCIDSSREHEVDLNIFSDLKEPGEITEDTYERYEVKSVYLDTDYWAYPETDSGHSGIELKVPELREVRNVNEIEDYLEQAMRAVSNPLTYERWLLEKYIEELDKFLSNGYKIFEELGYKENHSCMFGPGSYVGTYSNWSEVEIEFLNEDSGRSINIFQSMFTGKLIINKVCSVVNSFGEFYYENREINSLSTEELKDIIKTYHDDEL